MGIVDGVINGIVGMATLQAQMNANETARLDQLHYYNDQKLWNSPEYQMNLRRLAGLNPYGDFPIGSVGQPTPVNLAQGVGEITGNMMSAFGSAADRYLQKLSYKLEVKRLQLENKKLDKDLEAIDTSNALKSSQTIYQDLVNVLTANTMDSKMQYSKAEAEDMLNRAFISSSQASHQDALLDAQVNQIMSLIGLQDAQKANVRYQTNTLLPEQLKIQQRAAEDTHNLSVEDLARKQLDNSDIKAIDSILENIGQSNNDGLKNFLKVILMVFKNMKK